MFDGVRRFSRRVCEEHPIVKRVVAGSAGPIAGAAGSPALGIVVSAISSAFPDETAEFMISAAAVASGAAPILEDLPDE
jgi:hypothetical protein